MPCPTFRLPAGLLALAAALAITTPALADAEPAVLSYDLFELTVPHVDLATCPAEFDIDTVFCRAVLTHADMHIFVFSYDEGSPFVASRSYPADGLDALFE
jgi:hypothetical protein